VRLDFQILGHSCCRCPAQIVQCPMGQRASIQFCDARVELFFSNRPALKMPAAVLKYELLPLRAFVTLVLEYFSNRSGKWHAMLPAILRSFGGQYDLIAVEFNFAPV